MEFTTDNLIDNLDKLGAWSSYGLAETALQHYFPDEYDEYGNCFGGTTREVELLEKLNCNCWQDAIIKYHKEIGYKTADGKFHPMAVNEY